MTIASPLTKPRSRTVETMERLFRSAAEVGGTAREHMLSEAVVAGVPLARTLASRYRGRGVDREDLEQVAYEYLVKAAHSYLPTEGSDFRSYAVPTIRGGIRHHFRDHAWAIKVPRRLQELQTRLNAAEPELAATLHRQPSPQELAAALDIDVREVLDAKQARGCFQPSSLDAPLGHDSTSLSMADRLADPANTYALVDQVESLQAAVEALPERDRLILQMRFVDHRTQAEIGAKIGVSQMQVSRLLRDIVTRLQRALTV